MLGGGRWSSGVPPPPPELAKFELLRARCCFAISACASAVLIPARFGLLIVDRRLESLPTLSVLSRLRTDPRRTDPRTFAVRAVSLLSQLVIPIMIGGKGEQKTLRFCLLGRRRGIRARVHQEKPAGLQSLDEGLANFISCVLG